MDNQPTTFSKVFIIGIIVIVVLLILSFLGSSTPSLEQTVKSSQKQTDSSQQKQQTNNLDLPNQVTNQRSTDIESQAKCRDDAAKYFSSKNYKNSDGFDYINHYNSKLNRCFILITGRSLNDNSLFIDLYDAIEGKHYATFNGHVSCIDFITNNTNKCNLDSGSIWFDGNDTKNPADTMVGFRGFKNGGGAGDENTQKQFMDAIQLFMNN